ncbi:hypothetical protein NHX12_006662 [Muraenolepis orangiensis]|uniref:Cell cycle control protein n=1 Tax=Muraenolepis orangiensis TaxID=630683 RepID=A0A9Q0DLI0_9TELE|nr:hypothetical protein NHX12_006662 [Muraenolepis orangiensis]
MGKEAAKTGPLARRPDNSAFMQQRLPAWSPMLTASTVLPFMYCMSVLCLLLGVRLSTYVHFLSQMDYTEAGTCNNCFKVLQTFSDVSCKCKVVFALEKAFKGDVFFYYGLQNFHQNLRKYMDSRDDAQMVGRKQNLKNPSSYCEPYIMDGGLPIAPCGAVANSMFNDSFSLRYHGRRGSEPVPLYRNGIAWYTDENVKFRNPHLDNQTLAQAFEGTTKPPYWRKPVYDLDEGSSSNNGFINEDLIVWMREAAFPNFKKLYGILKRTDGVFARGLPAGNYSLDIAYNFPVQHFKGRKEVVLSTVTWLGGQNHFLPIAYLVTSGLVMLIAIVLTVIWWKFGRKGKNMEE